MTATVSIVLEITVANTPHSIHSFLTQLFRDFLSKIKCFKRKGRFYFNQKVNLSINQSIKQTTNHIYIYTKINTHSARTKK